MSDHRVVEALRAAFAGLEHNDRSRLVELLADDFHFEMSDSLPYGGVFIGPAEFDRFWAHVAERWQYFRYEAHEIVEAGDTVVVPVRTDALSFDGISMRNEHLFLFKVRDGRITFCRLYADTARGRDVMAGREPQRFTRNAPPSPTGAKP
ncbi:nuclear transport factor 2 family protein [Streptomyces flaveus]|uniref:nuclear transport factor 2 family protein n=1 Tax=Streptomyces flaveus TaxID=66370 RepID=UPI00332989E8